MPRGPKHPSGAAKVVTVRLSPAHVEALDRLRRGGSRSELFGRLIEAAVAAEREPVAARVEPVATDGECVHPAVRRRAISGGLLRCDLCSAVRGPDGRWR